jgi:protein-tyrosine phosphatase
VLAMIDIHCHILSGIDDGAKTMEDSVELAKAAVKEGIHTIIATPHHMNGRYENTKSIIIENTALLNQHLIEEKIPVSILPGQETAIHGEIMEGLENDEIQTLNDTQYLFIELPSGYVPRYTEKLLFDIQLKGLIPIIVHPERNQEIVEKPDLLYQFIKKGALSQVTASSINGKFGKKVKSFSEQLIEANLVHFIASDAHNLTNRAFHLESAYDYISNRYGVDMTYLYRENAELLVEGSNVYREVPQRVKKKKFLGIF